KSSHTACQNDKQDLSRGECLRMAHLIILKDQICRCQEKYRYTEYRIFHPYLLIFLSCRQQTCQRISGKTYEIKYCHDQKQDTEIQDRFPKSLHGKHKLISVHNTVKHTDYQKRHKLGAENSYEQSHSQGQKSNEKGFAQKDPGNLHLPHSQG